jgi:Colicin V production protein
MMFLFLLLIFAAVTAALWFQGLWSAAVTLVNLLVAMMVATSFYEPICTSIESIRPANEYTYLLDFVVLWLLFGIVFGILRAVTDGISTQRVGFDLPVEMAGRSLFAAWCGWLMVCFVVFSLQMAPLNSPNPLGAWATPSAKTFGPVSPDRLWLGFMHSRSKGAIGGQQFDLNAEFPLKYHERRVKYAAPGQTMRFPR